MADFTTRDGCFEAFLEQKKRAEDLEAALAMKWISVDERLPQERIRVLAWDGAIVEDCFYGKPGSITQQHLCCDWRLTWNEALNPGITHWQPLPAPPDEKENDG